MDDHPELEGHEPFEEKPLRRRWVDRAIKAAALLAIFLLIMPFAASQATVAATSAQRWCTEWVNYEINEPATADANFEIFGPGFLGWECYATNIVGGDRYLGYLGIIPGPPNLPDGGVLV